MMKRRMVAPLSESDRKRHREIRERIQREKPTLDQVIESGEYAEPVALGEYLAISDAMRELREARKAAGLSLADVSEKCGMDVPALSRLESGRHSNPTIETLSRYAKAIGREFRMGFPIAKT